MGSFYPGGGYFGEYAPGGSAPSGVEALVPAGLARVRGVTRRVVGDLVARRTARAITERTVRAQTVAATYAALVLGDGAVAYWRLDEAGLPTAADRSGGGHDGTYQNTPTFGAAGALAGGNAAVTFGPSNTGGRIFVPEHATFRPPAFSLELWVYHTAYGTSGFSWLAGKANAAWTNGYALYLLAGTLNFFINEWTTHKVSVAWTLNAWHHIVGTYNGATLRLYVDAVSVGTPLVYGPIVHNVVDVFGIAGDGHDVTYGVGGTLDEVAFYPTALTPAQVAAHYSLGLLGGAATTGRIVRALTTRTVRES